MAGAWGLGQMEMWVWRGHVILNDESGAFFKDVGNLLKVFKIKYFLNIKFNIK